MTESFQQYIKIRTFLGYRPKEILIELQNAFGDQAPTYASVQRYSKRFRDAIDSSLGTPLSSQSIFETQEDQQLDRNNVSDITIQKQINTNANKSESKYSIVNTIIYI